MLDWLMLKTSWTFEHLLYMINTNYKKCPRDCDLFWCTAVKEEMTATQKNLCKNEIVDIGVSGDESWKKGFKSLFCIASLVFIEEK